MNTHEAIAICKEWFEYLYRQREQATKLQELASRARKGTKEANEARVEMLNMDRSLTVYDGDRLEPAVKHLVNVAEAYDE